MTPLEQAAKALALRTLKYVRPVQKNMECDAEMERLALEMLRHLGIPDPTTKIGSRRGSR